MGKVKNIIFDFDGTIADTFEEITDILLKHKEDWGLPNISREDINTFRSHKSQDLIKLLGIPMYKVPFILAKSRNELSKSIEGISSIEGIETAISKLNNKNYNLGILTSNSKKNVEKYLISKNILGMSFVYSNTNLWGKDKSLLKIIKRFKLNRTETLYVGDETRDIEAAKKVGIKSCAVSWGFQNKGILESLNPDYIVDLPSQLSDLF